MNPSTLATVLIFTMLFCILASLGAGLYYLVKDQGKTKRIVRALSVRIILSLVLFAALLIAFAMGWIAPHGLLQSQ
ncbi:MAG TPA: twin transmembrane helix small protein [Gammaproteobacteria bacterium]|nr:twin transmembrane helix small protein [Gammaproteobacteria bacterium]HQZ87204.1 twin transmembrane helix small protein [Gammaproteobacteria bacterium]